MAIEQLQFAPVFTPRTLRELARILHDDQRKEVADIVSDLVPVLLEVIENVFKPISQIHEENDFRIAFDRFSREFEPYRLWTNITLLRCLDGAAFFEVYREAFTHLNEDLLRSASAKHIPAERIKRIVESYFAEFASLIKTTADVEKVRIPAKVDELNLADSLRNSTKLDYGLTSLFLILEGTIPAPPPPISELLLVATEDSLKRFAELCDVLTRATSVASQAHGRSKQATFERAQELKWLTDHSGVLRDLGGEWIVIEGDRLVANHPSYEVARDNAIRAGVLRPFIIFVPRSTEAAFMGL